MSFGEWVLIMVGFYVFAILIPVIIYQKCKSPEKKEEEQERFARNRAALAEKRRADEEKEKLASTIVEVKLLDGGSTNYKRGGLGGAAFGGFIGGVPGAIVGAVLPSGKGKQMQKFAVRYGDGSVKIRECELGSSEYNSLMKYVKWEEIQ